ncbi:DUF998 domain-containing protein [Luteimonas deserti]|uniref:DUF998 domain-containing protein n=1 Tax=Luteimonas deserti TaxID=2752306 RepID=A0A7Z0QRH9_9GAMM|nr:DUF998 domain-containing protein [Luteimonas deserti]NYZ62641.1 DUF998 domain-containing protein [Luteimonas deserti]
MTRARRLRRVLGAHGCTLLALVVFAAMTGVPARAPLALPGAGGLPLAWLFNLLAWIGPGLVVAGVALRLRAGLGAGPGRIAGIALNLLLLAALAFAAQGLLPLDVQELDAGASRWHALAWMVWNLAFAAGALLAGLALPSVRVPSLGLCAVVTLGLLSPGVFGGGIGERVVLACWWLWTLALAWRLPRQR